MLLGLLILRIEQCGLKRPLRFSSSFILILHVNIENDDYYFDNDRVEEIDGDSLIKVNVTNALGADNSIHHQQRLARLSGGGKSRIQSS